MDDPVVFDVPAPFVVEGIVGQGAYGAVCKAKYGDELRAIKKIPNYSKSCDSAKKVLREVQILQQHQYCQQVICCHTMFRPASGDKDVYVVMDFQPSDLSSTIKDKNITLDEDRVRYIVAQLLLGLRALHANDCIHRDLSTRNILINEDSQVYLCDFGLSRFFDPDEQLSFGVVTQWYRAPEIILDAQYDFRADVWSVGVILGELLLRKHLFPGKPNDHADQLNRIFMLCGTPSKELFAEGRSLARSSENARRYSFMYIDKRPTQPHLAKVLEGVAGASPSAVALFSRLLTFDQAARPTANEALQDPWFEPLRDFINQEMEAMDSVEKPAMPTDSGDLADILQQIETLVKPFPEALKAMQDQEAEYALAAAKEEA
jgi:serine/threonine protein kinase